MGFASDSEWKLHLVIWLGAGAFALVLLMLLQILAMRLLLVRRGMRRARFMSVWKPLLMQCLEAVPADLPHVARRDAFTFLSVWNYLHESLLDEAKERLNEAAHMVKMDERARGMMRRRRLGGKGVRNRLMAVTTLGHLRDESVWNDFHSLAMRDNTMLSLAAAKAMVETNARRAVPLLIPLIAERQDWSATRVAAILKEAGANIFSEPLAHAVLKSPPGQAARLMRLLEVAHTERASLVVRQVLTTTDDAELLRICLHLVGDPADAPLARRFLDHPQWLVRMEAAKALGRIGTAEDEERLTALLKDREWWVRYRAAQALSTLPSVTPQRLDQLAAAQTDLFAHDILRHVAAEQNLAERNFT